MFTCSLTGPTSVAPTRVPSGFDHTKTCAVSRHAQEVFLLKLAPVELLHPTRLVTAVTVTIAYTLGATRTGCFFCTSYSPWIMGRVIDFDTQACCGGSDLDGFRGAVPLHGGLKLSIPHGRASYAGLTLFPGTRPIPANGKFGTVLRQHLTTPECIQMRQCPSLWSALTRVRST